MAEEQAYLADLDGEIGDADHGVAMADGFAAAPRRRLATAQASPDADLNPLAAHALLNEVGATTGPLYASAFCAPLRLFAGLDAIPCRPPPGPDPGLSERHRRPRPGQAPATRRWSTPGPPPPTPPPVPSRWPCATRSPRCALPRKGAEATRAMVASKGRAARLGDAQPGPCGPRRGIGCCLILDSLRDGPRRPRIEGNGTWPRTRRQGRGRPRSPLRFGEDPLLWAAWLYYEEGLTQGDIAAQMGVSRAVGERLSGRRAHPWHRLDRDRAEQVPRASHRPGTEGPFRPAGLPCHSVVRQRRQPADRPARRGRRQDLAALARSGDTIAVTWGRTMLALAEAGSQTSGLQDLRVVQATGGTTAKIPWTPEACATRLGRSDLAPAASRSRRRRSSPQPRCATLLLREPVLAEQMAVLAEANRIILGISSLRPGEHHPQQRLLRRHSRTRLLPRRGRQRSAGRFISARGSAVDGPLDERTIGIDLASLARVRQRIGVAGGMDKVPAILAALRGGYVNVMVTDAATGRGILTSEGTRTRRADARARRRRARSPRAAGSRS